MTVRGTLPDDAAKAKAIDLIKDTVGVTRVIDQLSVLSTSETRQPRGLQTFGPDQSGPGSRTMTIVECMRFVEI